MCGWSSQSSTAAGLGAAARASASGFSGAAMAPVPSSSSRAAVQVTAHGSQSRLSDRRVAGAMPVSVPHRRQEKSRVIPAQSRQIRTPSRRPGSTRPPAPQPGQVPATASAVVRHRWHRCPSGKEAAGYPWCPHRAQVRFFAGWVTARDAAWRGPGAARSGRSRRPCRRRRRPRRAGTFSARVAISCAGVTSKMSHNAASTGSDSRSGVWVTSRHTCTDDKRDAPAGQQRLQVAGVEQPGCGHHLPQPPLVGDLPHGRHHALRPGRIAAAAVASSARRSVRVRKSEDTQV